MTKQTTSDNPLPNSIATDHTTTEINRYTQQARAILLEGNIYNRAFDDCFENYSGEQVVCRLMALARTDDQLAHAITRNGLWDSWEQTATRNCLFSTNDATAIQEEISSPVNPPRRKAG